MEIITGAGNPDIMLKLPEELEKGTSVIVFATHILRASRQMKERELKAIQVVHKSYNEGISLKDGYLKKYGCMPRKEDKVKFAVMAVNNMCGLTGSKIYITPIMM